MRAIVITSFVLLSVFWIAVTFAGGRYVPSNAHKQTPSAAGDQQWRRTAQGWERADFLHDRSARQVSRIHPTLVALFEMLVSVFALLAMSPRMSQPATGWSHGNAHYRADRAARRGASPAGQAARRRVAQDSASV